MNLDMISALILHLKEGLSKSYPKVGEEENTLSFSHAKCNFFERPK